MINENCINFESLNRKIQKLADKPEKIVSLAMKNNISLLKYPYFSSHSKVSQFFVSLFLEGVFSRSIFDDCQYLPYKDSTHCYCLADAIFEKNYFKQRYVVRCPTFKAFEAALQDNEPGIFHLSSKNAFYLGNDLEEKYFPAHAMVLIKFNDNEKFKFQVIQIFQGRYTLPTFLKDYKNYFKYDDFNDLRKNFLKYLERIYFYKEVWSDREEKAYQKVTLIKLNLEGHPVPFDNKTDFPNQPRWKIKRTTNKSNLQKTLNYKLAIVLTIYSLILLVIFRKLYSK